jgi:hypothetical protein
LSLTSTFNFEPFSFTFHPLHNHEPLAWTNPQGAFAGYHRLRRLGCADSVSIALLIILATAIALIVYSAETFVADRPSSVFGVVFASLVIGHFLVPIARRTPILYGVLLILGIISTFYFAFGSIRPLIPWLTFRYGQTSMWMASPGRQAR